MADLVEDTKLLTASSTKSTLNNGIEHKLTFLH